MMENKGIIIRRKNLSFNIFKIEIEAPELAAGVRAGQFVHLEVPGFSLRRPFTVAAADQSNITLVVRPQGQGTAALRQAAPGTELRLLGPLGRGFSPPTGPALLLGGGIGAAALTLLAQRLPRCTFVMGRRNKDELWLEQLNLPSSVEIQYATDDGSRGFHGNLVDYACQHLQPGMWVAACGPQPMLRGLQQLLQQREIPGEFALEQRMACGVGACMGCACKTIHGNALVCKDGPVFPAQEVVLI